VSTHRRTVSALTPNKSAASPIWNVVTSPTLDQHLRAHQAFQT
jgi:hypothetical protein